MHILIIAQAWGDFQPRLPVLGHSIPLARGMPARCMAQVGRMNGQTIPKTRGTGTRPYGCLSQAVKKPLWEVWRAEALQMQSASGDMCGGFASLAVQGFRLSKKPSGRFGGPKSSKYNPNPATCAADSGLAAQGFLAPFPAREPRRGERETALTFGKGRRRRTFSTR